MKPADLLRRQHRDLIGLLVQLQRATAIARRGELLERSAHHLALHCRLEEEVAYPTIATWARSQRLRRRVPVLIEQHRVLDRVLADWRDADPRDGRFPARATVVRELVAQHVAEEEAMLATLDRTLSPRQLQRLERELAAAVATQGSAPDAGAPDVSAADQRQAGRAADDGGAPRGLRPPRRARRLSEAPVGDRGRAERIVDQNEMADRSAVDDLRTEVAAGEGAPDMNDIPLSPRRR
jgi:hypothetical protein